LIQLRPSVIIFPILQKLIEHLVEILLRRETVDADLNTDGLTLIILELDDDLCATDSWLLWLIEDVCRVVQVCEALVC
jgi:hypothetical protein